MRDVLGPGTILGYCTNVHAGNTLDEIKRNLTTHALAVKRRVSPKAPMGVGLWFPASVASEIASDETLLFNFRDWLNERDLLAYTINGFPYGDFHRDIVKHDVYQPDWSMQERFEFTTDLVEILHALLPEGEEGSISTLPLGWGNQAPPGWPHMIGGLLDELATLFEQTGRLIHLDIEPEPGCVLDMVAGVLFWFMAFRALRPDREAFERHMRVCFDLCHQAVMFEPPALLLEWSRGGDFKIGKVQISSGLAAPFRGRSPADKQAMVTALESFVEPRYLHQTVICARDGRPFRGSFDDLPGALAAQPPDKHEWRVHYHVPIFFQRIGPLETTQRHIIEFFKALRPEDGVKHFEVETYAWNVLPPELREAALADGIARELLWVKNLAAELGLTGANRR